MIAAEPVTHAEQAALAHAALAAQFTGKQQASGEYALTQYVRHGADDPEQQWVGTTN